MMMKSFKKWIQKWIQKWIIKWLQKQFIKWHKKIKPIRRIQSNTYYSWKIIALTDEYIDLENAHFNQCVFINPLLLKSAAGCTFTQCTFKAPFKLTLTGKGLKQIPDYVFGLTELHSLDLVNTNLIELPKALKNLTNLRQIFIGHTDLDPHKVYDFFKGQCILIHT